MYLIFGLVMVGIIGAYLASHYFFYRSLVYFFNIVKTENKTILAAALFVLAISYIVASILAHIKENAATRAFYFSASLWLGVAVNLTAAFVLVWATALFARLAGWQFDLRILAGLAIVAALAYSAYGLWSAYNPAIKNISIKIKNLPAGWRGKRAVLISDVHLGHVFDDDFLKEVVEKINGQNPDVVFIAGDLFDGMDGDLHLRVRPLDDLRASLGAYFITGNHETYFGVERAFEILRKTKVKILDDRMENINGLQILGVSYPWRNERKDVLRTIKNMPGFDPGRPSVLMYHSPSARREAKTAGASLLLSGHTHAGQIFPINFITRFIFGKYHYGLRVEGDFATYTSSGVGAWGPTMRTGRRPEIVVIKFE
ncbi:hypothetical protein EPN28_01365 [Patescibacteria group bacterium]|nr:MAG: hypothetical protein EPN28_01365 [Patescibacteria group bacterium]